MLGRLRRVEVHGPSMLPALEPGDRLLVLVTGRVRPGDVVVVRDPSEQRRLVVKRVQRVVPEGIDVRGDHADASRDSRVYGPVPRPLLIGRAWWRYYPRERAGMLGRPGVAAASGPTG